ncbi:hypothetical protein ACVJGD_005145 [Bradyrhizobium sp. USDA 10063]
MASPFETTAARSPQGEEIELSSRLSTLLALIQMSNSYPLSSSAKADDLVFQRRQCLRSDAAGYWMPAFAGMTVEYSERT